MKKFLRYSHLLTLLCGILGMLLMVWLRAGGPDEKGLYPARHPAWTLLGILTTVILVCLWLLSSKAGNHRGHRTNFPPSPMAAIGYVLAGSSMICASLSLLENAQMLEMLTAILGLLSCCALFYGGFCRFNGTRSPISLHALPCLFFTLQLFCLGKSLGAETQISVYLYPFLSTLTSIPACYWLWSFEVDQGNRSQCLFWCMAAAYCNLVACIGSEQWMVYVSVALWLLSALPRLKYVPKRLRPETTQQQADAADWPTPPNENVQAQVASHTPPVQDVDMILEQILWEFGTQDTP